MTSEKSSESRASTNLDTRLPKRKRSLAAAAGLGMLAIIGTGMAATSPHTGWLMNGTSAAAAEATAPPATEMPSFASLVDRLKPSVVSIYVEAETNGMTGPFAQHEQEQQQQPNPFGQGQGSPFDFFRQFGAPQQRHIVRAQGSGFFISADGYVLTNHHVVDHAKTVKIKTIEGKTYQAKVVGSDEKTDLAVLKVDAGQNFPFVSFASSAPRVGDWVLAMGNPYGLGGTVTAGIVSANGRDIGSGPYDYLQIDAPVNKGNSGGPSFNMRGEVVGINTAIYSPSGGSIGIAFDIPAQTAKEVAQELKAHGSVTRGWIGVSVQPVTADIADSLGLQHATGALVDQVQPNSPAAKAGLQNGDVIVSLGGSEIKDSRDLARKVAGVDPGKAVEMQIRRGGQDKTVNLTTGSYPRQDQRASAEQGDVNPRDAKLGLYLAPANAVEGAGSHGVVVMGVDPNGSAAEKGVRQGDVILDAGGKAVSSPDDVIDAVHQATRNGRHTILMRVKTAQGAHYVALPIETKRG